MKSQLQRQPATKPAAEPAPRSLLQRKCACGGTPGFDGECAACRAKRLQRRATEGAGPSDVPPIVHEVLRSPGQPLDAETRSFMEPRFGHDFSRVRVHTGARAAESARAVNALAYTVGRDVVFGEGQYAPGASAGRRLLAHELAHVVQQGDVSGDLQQLSLDAAPGDACEREARVAGQRIASGLPVAIRRTTTPHLLQRQVMVEEPAGGCGVCHGPRNAGSIAHRLIQEEFEILFPLGLVEFPISSPTDENGRLDLAIATPHGLEIGEIKPANTEGYFQGATDMSFYFTALQTTFRGRSISPLGRILSSPVTIFPNPQTPLCPLQTLYVNPPVSGVYGYYCQPSYSQIVGNPNCRCGGRREPVRVPVTEPVPAPAPSRRNVLQKIRDFIRQVVESGANAEEAALRFLAEHPEVPNFLIGAAIGIVVATLVEDLATLGAGILDDPASFAAAYALVRVAQSAH